MKLLMGVKGCWRDNGNGYHQAMRDTWVRDVPAAADIKFFMGAGAGHSYPDEVVLDCSDDYMSLPHKTRAILRWSLDRGYDFTFLCDSDTYVIPDRLLTSGFEDYDLVGLFNGAIGVPNATEGRYWAWISGGNGFWLSRRASEVIVNRQYDGDWAEDRFVGQSLGPYFASGAFKAFSHQGYGFHFDGDFWKTWITSHYCSHGLRRSFDPRWMHNRYAYNMRAGIGMVHQ